jgi:acetyltransferase
LGVRGENRKDLDSLVDAVIKLGALVRKCPGISDIKVNPLIVYDQGQGVKAVDVRILLSNPKEVA